MSHAFISSRIDFGNAVYSGLGSSLTLKLQSALNASVHLIGAILKFGNISTYMRDAYTGSLTLSLSTFMRNCLMGIAPNYLGSLRARN